MDDLTALIAAWEPRGGVPVDALWHASYGELKKLARASLRGGGGELTLLQPTALVNEAYLKLAGQGRLRVEGRRQFFAYCARVMRSVVLDLWREKQALRRGQGGPKLSLDAALEEAVPAAADEEPLRVDAALRQLESAEPRLAQVVEMRYFAGFTEAEIADILGLTERTVRRDWQKAKLLLRALLEP